MTTRYVRHNRIRLALHELRDGSGTPLLLLHGLGESTPEKLPTYATPWPGPVYGLDFTGHGRSTRSRGGGYSAEVLMGDVDAVLAELGPVAIIGRGLGAYVALLIAGSRATMVRGVVLADGPGLTGGSTGPTSAVLLYPPGDATAGSPDPWALVELTHDVRPPDYALTYARQAFEHSGLAEPIIVSAVGKPAWLVAVAAESGVPSVPLTEAVAHLRHVQ